MKKIGLVGIVAGALSAVVIGFAGPAQADDYGYGSNEQRNDRGYGYGYGYGRDHRNNPWNGQLFPSVRVPQVDTSVRQRPVVTTKSPGARTPSHVERQQAGRDRS